MKHKVYLAVDLGAESGRVMAGLWNGKRMRLEEVHRFANGGTILGESLRWDVLRLWAEIQNGLALAGKKYGKQIVSVATVLISKLEVWIFEETIHEDDELAHAGSHRDERLFAGGA